METISFKELVMTKNRHYFLLPALLGTILLTGCSSSAANLDKTGMNYYRQGNYAEAATSFDAAIFKDNSKPEYYIHLAFAYIELGDYTNALSKVNFALELDPNNQEAYRCQGIALIALNRYEEAISSLNKALSYADGFVSDIEYDILDYSALAELKNGNYEEAIKTYTILLNVGYQTGEHYFLRGCAYLANQNPTDAFNDFQEALKASDATYDRYLNVYTCLSQYGYTQEATSYLEEALLLNTGKQENYFAKGKIYYYLGDYENALTNLLSAQSKGNQEALLYIGKIYASQGDSVSAFSTFEQYLEKGLVNGEVYNQMGIIKFNQRDYESALSYFEAGLDCNDLNARKALLYNEAVTYEYLLDFDTAAEKMANYVTAYPNDSSAARENDFLKTR